jgi:hypothetical protein
MEKHGEDYWIDLGRRWVAAGCGWMPGVVTMPDGLGRTWRKTARGWVQDAGARFRSPMARGSEFPPPDLRDPATVGCLEAEVREAWGHEMDIESDWYDGPIYRVVGHCPAGTARADNWSAHHVDEDCRHRAGVWVQAREAARPKPPTATTPHEADAPDEADAGQREVVAALEEMLALARAGRLDAIVCAGQGVGEDGALSTSTTIRGRVRPITAARQLQEMVLVLLVARQDKEDDQ